MQAQRILVVGSSGSGKTSSAARIAERLDIVHIELDALHWQPNWQMQDTHEFRREAAEIAATPSWVIDGNYGKVRDVILPRVQTLVHLDLPFWTVLSRLLTRTLRRGFKREELWAGNRESLLTAFFSYESVLYYMLRTFRRRRRQFLALGEDPDNGHLQVVRLRSQAEIDDWIAALPSP